MKKNIANSKGVTLIALVITVIVLLILASIATYSGMDIIESSKLNTFTAEMKIMQTQVNSLYDKWQRGEVDINTLGESLDYNPENPEVSEQANKVLKDELFIDDISGYRYYNKETIQDLGIEGVKQEFFINVEQREVVSYKGLKYDGDMYYTLIQLPDGLYNVDYNPEEASKPAFNLSYERIGDNQWKITISDIQYDGYVNKWTVKYQLSGKDYENTTEDLSFVVNEAGVYNVTLENENAKIGTEQLFVNKVNKPKLSEGMIPIKWENTNWVICSENDPGWYSYVEQAENGTVKWANVMLSDGKYYATNSTTVNKTGKEEARIGTKVAEADLGSMFVWIPRYSYSISYTNQENKNEGGEIEVSFLQDDTNKEVSGNETSKTVHPGFEMDGKQLEGIWVAKFEASGKNSSGEYVGNASSGSSNTASTTGAYVMVKPSVPSWRHITVGESQYQSMKISTDTARYGATNINSHLMKNAEWGTVAYLCYSEYGVVPQINACGSYINGYYYDMMTGAGPQESGNENRYSYGNSTFSSTYAYNTSNGKLASTTGNETGVYDMNGGAWERVAAYLDNTNRYLSIYGKSTTDSNIQYFNSNNELNSGYSAYWEKYDVSEEERSNQIKISDGQTLTQDELWDATKQDVKYQEARLRLTKANFDLMASHKGIGVNEVTDEFSYYGAYNNGTKNTWNWFTTVDQPANRQVTYGRAWDNDYVLIGHAAGPFVMRGGNCDYSSGAGVFSSFVTGGGAGSYYSFRPVLAF